MNKILTNIEHGWCDFNLGDYDGRPSYIRFLPLDIINGWKEYQESQHCIIEFDCEMYQFCLVIWENTVTIIDNRYEKRISTFLDFNAKDILEELVDEIVDNLDLWAEWISTTGTEDNIKRCKNLIIKHIRDAKIPCSVELEIF